MCFSLKAGQDWVLRWGWETLIQGAVLRMGVSGLGAQPPLQNMFPVFLPSLAEDGEQGFPERKSLKDLAHSQLIPTDLPAHGLLLLSRRNPLCQPSKDLCSHYLPSHSPQTPETWNLNLGS